MANYGRSIRIYLVEGDPDGRWICELSSWTGKAFKIPRTMVMVCGDRPELAGPGIYFLFGKNDDDFSDQVYIGEAENILDRLGQHIRNTNRSFWTECVVFVSKGDSLNKAHIKYLESRIYALVKSAGRYRLVNGNTPPLPSLSESDKAEMEEFIDNVKLLINTIGHRVLDPIIQGARESNDEYYYIKSSRGAEAKGKPVSQGFAVVIGSKITSTVVNSMASPLISLRAKLLDARIISEDYTFIEDYVFTSPSLAAAIVLGRNANGQIEWKNEVGRTLREVETAGLSND